MSETTSRERVARNFLDRFGADGLRALLDALAQGESGQVIADRFHVSRERVRQWKNAFGSEVVIYQVHPRVATLLREASDAT
jgi:lauroyl/myristoyl acyltransferase